MDNNDHSMDSDRSTFFFPLYNPPIATTAD
jgi:hypothetical protein